MRNTARSRGARSTTGRRPSSVSRFRSSFFLERGTGRGAAGRDRTVSLASVSSLPPGARGSSRQVPVAVTAHSSVAPSRASFWVQTHWNRPVRVRRVTKVMPPMSRRAWTAPWMVTDWLFRPPTALSICFARNTIPFTTFLV